MRRFALFVGLVAVGCGARYVSDGTDVVEAPPERGDAATDATTTVDSGGSPSDAAADAAPDATTDAGPQIPFASHLVLRFETDAPNGQLPSGAWRDLSSAAHAVTLAQGTVAVESVGNAGAKAIVFGGASSPIFDVADAPDLRFGATDDFFVVARATVAVPLEAGSGCSFHYLLAKFGPDTAVGPNFRVCAPNTGQQLVGSLSVGLKDVSVAVPPSLQSTYDVISFGRNASGTRIESRAGGASFETTVTTVDVSTAVGPLVIGGARLQGTAGAFGTFIGKVNRMYVYHAPMGTFTNGDFDAIRSFVKTAAPLP